MRTIFTRRQIETVLAAMLAAVAAIVGLSQRDDRERRLGPKFLTLQKVGRFDQPVHLSQPPGVDSPLFVVERPGRVEGDRRRQGPAQAVPRHPPVGQDQRQGRRAGTALDRVPARLRRQRPLLRRLHRQPRRAAGRRVRAHARRTSCAPTARASASSCASRSRPRSTTAACCCSAPTSSSTSAVGRRRPLGRPGQRRPGQGRRCSGRSCGSTRRRRRSRPGRRRRRGGRRRRRCR